MKSSLRWAFVALTILIAMLSYIGGYARGRREVIKNKIRGQLEVNLHLRRSIEGGDIAKAKRDLDFTIWAGAQAYTKRFGRPNGTNGFAVRFAEAEKIARDVKVMRLEDAIKGSLNPEHE